MAMANERAAEAAGRHTATPTTLTRNDAMEHLREFDWSDADIEAIVAIHNELWPEWPETPEGRRRDWESRNPRYFVHRVVWEEDGKVVAYGSCSESAWSYKPGKYAVYIQVLPAWQKRGIGTQIYDYLAGVLDGRELEPKELVSDTREDKGDYKRFLEKRGYKVVQRQEVSRLDPQAFDPTPYAEKRQRFDEAGLRIVTGTEFAAEHEDWRKRLYDLDWELLQDVPTPDPLTRQPLEQWVKEELEHPAFMLEGWFLAMDGDEIAGMTSFWRALADPTKLFTGLTGVRRPYRRKGIATVLKSHAIGFAKKSGIVDVITDNEEHNPMFDLNVQLGFKKMPGWLVYRKVLTE